MSFSPFRRSLPQRFLLVLTSFLQKSGLAFSDALPEEAIQAAFDAEDVAFAQEEDDVYTPALTLWRRRRSGIAAGTEAARFFSNACRASSVIR